MKSIRTKILLLTSAVMVLACIYIASIVNHKPPLENASDKIINLNITDSTKAEITDIVHKSGLIEGIQVVTIHFRRNIRTETFTSISNDAVQLLYDAYINNKIAETPLFTSEKQNNSRLLKLINGEFICTPFEESTAYTYAPGARKFVAHICAMGIPPLSNGEFTGIITVYLNKAPTADETRTIYLLSRDLSLKIHEDNTALNGNKFKFGLGIN